MQNKYNIFINTTLESHLNLWTSDGEERICAKKAKCAKVKDQRDLIRNKINERATLEF